VNKRVWLPIAFVGSVGLILIILAWLLFARVESTFGPDPVSIASASLSGLQEQNRLTVFEASYNASVTTSVTRLGFSARKTLILPGVVRYELDLAKLKQDDVRWDDESENLSIRLPVIEVARPEVQLDRIQTYENGGVLMALTNAEEVLDQANRKKALTELTKQAQNPVQMQLAQDAAKRAVESSFALPLKAAGLNAKVDAFFPFEGGGNQDQWDLSRPIREVLAESKEKEKAQ